jgi:hypothetical protein
LVHSSTCLLPLLWYAHTYLCQSLNGRPYIQLADIAANETRQTRQSVFQGHRCTRGTDMNISFCTDCNDLPMDGTVTFSLYMLLKRRLTGL